MTRSERQIEDAVLIEQYQDNIRTVAGLATEQEIHAGAAWYDNAREFCNALAHRYALPFETVAYVVSALSPNNSWESNQQDAETVVAGFCAGKRWNQLKGIQTYPNNVRKAYDILRTGELALVKANKTASFAHNIAYQDSPEVTIDVHAYSIATGIRYTVSTLPHITDRRYRNARLAYQTVAAELGLQPKQLQAITWIVWHRLIRARQTDIAQLAFEYGHNAVAA